MAGQCIEKIYHKDCGDHLVQVFQDEDGKYTGYCYPLSKYISDPYEDQPKGYIPKVKRKTPEEIQEEINQIAGYKTLALPDRKLKKQYLEYFDIKIGVSEEDGVTPKLHYYPYYDKGKLVAYKVRIIENKRMFSVGDQKDVDLFGWEQALQTGGKRLFIVEGELDAVSLFQICKEANAGNQYADLNPAVVSVAHGAAGAAKDIAKFAPVMQREFKEIVLCFDNDEAGQNAVEEILKILPDALVAVLPSKDANQCILDGKSKQAWTALQFKAAKPKNTRLITASSVIEDARKEVPWGYSYPYKALTNLTRGRRFGETYYFGAGVKMGKSELLNDLVAWDIKEHGWKVFVVKPEESNKRTLQGIVGKLVNRVFHDPAVPFDYDAFDKGIALLGDNLVMLNLYQELAWENLKVDIRAAVQDGCKSIYIDPITVLSDGINAADANTLLQKMARELSIMAADLQVIVHIFCHLKAHDGNISQEKREKHYKNGEYIGLGNCPHEFGGDIFSSQFAGSRAMMRSCNSMIGILGNKDPDLPKEIKNMRTLVLLEDRMTGNSGKVRLFWDESTGAFNEIG